MSAHQPTCPRYCPFPDLTWVAAGATLPKCRGGDCTLCDEGDCTCKATAHKPEDAGHDADVGAVARQIRAAANLWACDPSNCPLCDCNMDDAGRLQIAGVAQQESERLVATVEARVRAEVIAEAVAAVRAAGVRKDTSYDMRVVAVAALEGLRTPKPSLAEELAYTESCDG